MKRTDVEKLLTSLDENFFKNMARDMKDLEPDIEPDPSIVRIKTLLGEVPAQIEYLQVRTVEVKKKIQEVKLFLKAERTSLELEKSKIRQEQLETYQSELRKYIVSAKSLFDDVANGKKKLPSSVLQEMIKAIKPEKPTQSNLDDLANLRTEEKQNKLIELERKVNEYEELYGILVATAEKFENKRLAVRDHKGLLEAEMRNGLNN